MAGEQVQEAPKIAEHMRGALDAKALEARIGGTWQACLESPDGRKAIAKALGVDPTDLVEGSAPFAVTKDSGTGVELLVIGGKLALTYIIAPVLVDIVKDDLKERLTRLWKQVLLPRIKAEQEDAVD